MYAIAMRGDLSSCQNSFFIVVALFASGTLYPIYINVVPRARVQVEFKKSVEMRFGEQNETERRPENSRRLSVVLLKLVGRINGGDEPSSEHRNRSFVSDIQHS